MGQAWVNDRWELSAEDLKHLIQAERAYVRAVREWVKAEGFWDLIVDVEVDMVDPVKVHDAEGLDPEQHAVAMALFEHENLLESLRQHRDVARDEDAILADFTPESFEVQGEKVRTLDEGTVEGWEQRLRVRSDRLGRLRDLGAPVVILSHAEELVEVAEAGLHWARAKVLAAANSPQSDD